MTKKFYYLIKVEDDDKEAKCNQFTISVIKKGERVPLEMIEVIDDDQHDNKPCIFF
jgi:hypothetical protein